MLIKIAYIELKKNLKSPALYIFSFILFLGALLFTFTRDPGTVFMGLSHGKEFYNSPILIAQLATRLGILGVLFTMILIGRSVAKDFEAGIHEIIFSCPVSKFNYLGGRFIGGFIANILVFFGLFLGFEIGFFGINIIYPGLCGPFRIEAYLVPLLFTVIPNILLTGSILFSLATLSRKMISTYIATIAFLGVYTIAMAGFSYIENDSIKILLDPFGLNGLNILTKYWTVTDMNQNMMPLSSIFLINRLFWLCVSVLVLVVTYKKFQFLAVIEGKSSKIAVENDTVERAIASKQPEYRINYSFGFHLKQCLLISFKEFKRILIHPAFIILTLLAMSQIVTNFVGNLGVNSDFPGANIYPFTSWYLNQTINLWMYMLPMAILFGGMLVWKEQDSKSDEVYNVLPLPNWFGYFTKFLTLLNIQVFYLLLAILTGVITQIGIFNFYDIELGLYFKQLLGIDLVNYIHLIIIVLLIQTLSPNKYLGFFFSVLYFAFDLIVFGSMGFENVLLRYGNIPKFTYSNMNGFGHFTTTIVWYTIYWAFLGAILITVTILLWRRTVESNLKCRFKTLRRNITRTQKVSLSILLFLFVSTGIYIAYNKYVVNIYISNSDYKQIQADYETKFQQYADKKQPTIVHVDLGVDLFPKNRRVIIKGTYQLKNTTDSTIDNVYLNLNDWNIAEITTLSFSKESELLLHAKEYGFRVFKVKDGIKSGEKVDFNFEYLIDVKGFTDNLSQNKIAENGTYIDLSGSSSEYFPVIGYNINGELDKDSDRKEFGLQQKPDLPTLELANRNKGFINLSRPTYNAIISTSIDQIPITNGSMIKKWVENGRNYYHYKSDEPMINEFAIISGRFEVKTISHKEVNIEVYYDKKHNFNIDRIISGLQGSYNYCTEYFSKYPYKDLRVVEVPVYMNEGGARHFPTLFTWRESSGFIANFEGGQELDMVYGIASHENAHHWWGNFVTPAFAEGGYMLSESLAQFVWAMTFEKKFGKDLSRRYLKEEMNTYLRRRRKDLEGEKPLSRSTFQQSYVGYQKSSVAMYALQDYIGEDSVGKALSRIVEKYGSRLDTFALASDVVNEYNRVTPDSLKYLVDDLFNKITIYENEVLKATCVELKDGKYQVDLALKTSKFYVDSIGSQTEAPLHDYIYIGLLDDKGKEIYYKKHLFTINHKLIKIITDSKPAKAGLDPFSVLIDRNHDNNLINVDITK